MIPNQTNTRAFEASSEILGTYTLGGSTKSAATYNRRAGSKGGSDRSGYSNNCQRHRQILYAGNGKGGVINDTFFASHNVAVRKDLQPPTVVPSRIYEQPAACSISSIG